MATIGRRCHELRIVDADATWRIIYRLDSDAIVIVEIFSKKTRTTPNVVIESCRRRLRLYDEAAREHENMKRTKRARLEAKGWRVGSTADFLELTSEEVGLVETRLTLSLTLRKRRASHHMTQAELARRLRSSQSRVAKMEAGDKSVSVDLLLRALFSLGAKPRDIGRALQRSRSAAA